MQNILAGLFFELRQSFGIATNRTIITGEISNASTFGSSDDKGHSFTLKDTTYESDYDMFGVTINISGGEAASDKDEGLGKSDEQIYITLNSLCTLLNNYVLVSDTNSATKNVATANKINGGKSRPLSPLTTNEMSGSDLVPLLALAHPLQVSIDPTVCLIKSPIWYEGIKIETEKDTKGEPVVTFSHNLSNPGGFVDRIISIIATKSSISDDGKELLAQVIKETIQGSSASRYGQGQINDNVKEVSKLYLEKFGDPTYKVSKPSDTDIAKFGLTINNADVGKTIKEIFTFNPADLEEFLNDRAAADFNDAKVTDILTSEGVTIAEGDPVKEAREKIKEEEEDLAEAAGESAEGFKFLKELEKEYFEKIINKDGSEGELGIIGNIYVNINMLYNLCANDNLQETDKKEKKEIAIYDYIKSVLKKISPAIGNVNNFDIFVNPDTNVSQIIDINYVDKLSADDAYANAFELQIHNLESIVRSYSLESKIFPEQMSIVAIAAQAGGGALGIDTTTLVAFNKSIRDRIIPIKDSPITPSTKPPGAAEIAAKIVTLKESLKILYIFGGDLDDNWWGGDRDFDVDDATKYQNALKDIISFFVELGKPKMKGKAILPTVLNIDMDGIGGIIIGNLFKTNTDILPKGYKNMGEGVKLGYLVTEIGHSLQGNDWVTKLAAQTIILEEPQGEGINFNDIVVTNEETKEKKIILGPDGKPPEGPPGTPPPGTPPPLGTLSKELIAYLTHNQGDAGIKSILYYTYKDPQNKVPRPGKFITSKKVNVNGNMYGKRLNGTKYVTITYSSWSTNVGDDFEKKFGDDADTSFTPANFLKYWISHFPKKIEEAKRASKKYDKIFEKYGKKYGISLDLIKVFAVIESGINPNNSNPKYKGMFALSPSEFSKLYPNGDIFDAEQNTDVGVKLIKDRLGTSQGYLDKYGP